VQNPTLSRGWRIDIVTILGYEERETGAGFLLWLSSENHPVDHQKSDYTNAHGDQEAWRYELGGVHSP